MTDGLRTALYWLSTILALIGVVLLAVALVQSRLKDKVRETTPWRVTSIAILLLAGGAVLAGIAYVWPHPPA